jgi:hypothetical protein
MATSKQTGQRCKRIALSGCAVCQFHGGLGGSNDKAKATARKNREANRKRMTENPLAALHAANAKRQLTPEEYAVYVEAVDICRQQYALDPAADELIVNEIGHYAAKVYRARDSGAPEATVTNLSHRIVKMLKELNVRKDCRDAKGDMTGKESPQAWFIGIVERAKANKAKLTGSVSFEIDGRTADDSGALQPARQPVGAIDISTDQEPALAEMIDDDE